MKYLIYKYGPYPFSIALSVMVYEEKYETAAEMHKFLLAHCQQHDIEIPKGLPEEIEDYKADFWRLGLSGETAELNLISYVLSILREIKTRM